MLWFVVFTSICSKSKVLLEEYAPSRSLFRLARNVPKAAVAEVHVLFSVKPFFQISPLPHKTIWLGFVMLALTHSAHRLWGRA
jgi:hypothetical protein